MVDQFRIQEVLQSKFRRKRITRSNISTRRALPDPDDGSSSDVTNKWKTLIEKESDKEIEDGSFICRSCDRDIAKGEDNLATFEMTRLDNEVLGLFRDVFNVVRNPEQSPDLGNGNFVREVLCVECEAHVGGVIERAVQPHMLGEHFVAGNYVMKMNALLVRSGKQLLDGATRSVVRYL